MMLRIVSVVALLTIASSAALAQEGLSVTSPDIPGGRFSSEQFADVFGCSGANVSPAIEWTGAPPETKSFSVSIYDPDAPTGSGFWHWIVTNIPASATGLPAGAGTSADLLPAGAVQMINDAGVAGYVGACPPAGETHDYVITVKALALESLPVSPTASGAMVGFVTNSNLLASGTLTATAAN